ncbi:MAG: TIGR01244 family phosphatase [Phyllobacteriaceae bacterium]|nr:TIGR01244 family phosphatase [Phyllobacteriaceae bacterium]
MATIKYLEPGVAVAPQLVAPDFAEIAALGFRTIVNNRPDGEAPDQLPHAEAKALAEAHGLAYHHQPLRGYEITDEENVDAFIAIASKATAPVLFYCRTGTRCTLLWAQYAAPRLGVEAVTAIAAKAGYDVSVVRDEMEERAALHAVAAE